MFTFMEKYFNRNLSEVERQAIAQDHPKPNCPALEVPRMDEEVRHQLKIWDGEDNVQAAGTGLRGGRFSLLLVD